MITNPTLVIFFFEVSWHFAILIRAAKEVEGYHVVIIHTLEL